MPCAIRSHAALIVVTGAALVLSGCVAAAPDEPTGTTSALPTGHLEYVDGADGAGDPYFPGAGNGGIDVQHYDLALVYTPPTDSDGAHLIGTADLRIVTTENLASFSLDLRDRSATGVYVDDRAVTFEQEDGELRITPAAPVAADSALVVRVEYEGDMPATELDRDGGWVASGSGGATMNEPHGAPELFPSNDHPTDKATYRFTVTVPDGVEAIANGTLESVVTDTGLTTWVWDAPDPMASYLALLAIGDYEIATYSATDGTPIIDAVSTAVAEAESASLPLAAEMMEYFEGLFGDYPFAAYGQVIADEGYSTALETQTRSIFAPGSADEVTMAHELAHQWFGDWVSPARWSDLWLNEGWATYCQWLWNEHHNSVPLDDAVYAVLLTGADAPEWDTPPAAPDPDAMFTWAVYQRGATSLHFLRQEIGDEDFFALAREWLARYGGLTASTEDFIALAEEVSGEELSAQFQEWVYEPGRPADW